MAVWAPGRSHSRSITDRSKSPSATGASLKAMISTTGVHPDSTLFYRT
ncbi:hypothetical protein ACFFX0_05865 [Citricoccus parietis]|uniref:Uncharacterized protein n=1 Tax=Citricoccus parietis TaxID=592307 RepID=A0ABV5FW98_9MICC